MKYQVIQKNWKVKNKVNNPLLERNIYEVLEKLGLPTDVTLDLRGYSKTYYGRYDIENQVITLYVLEEDNTYLPYEKILQTAIHEAIHHFQHTKDKAFVRVHGVMHNQAFLKLEEKLYKRLKTL